MSWLTLISVAYAVMSCLTFMVYVVDKRAAINNTPRTSELTLHVLELMGGWPGAFCAQRLVRHKNAKISFQIIYWMTVAVHVAAWGAWYKLRAT